MPTDLNVGLDVLLNDMSKKYVYNGITFSSIVIKTFNEYDCLKKEFIVKKSLKRVSVNKNTVRIIAK